MQLSDVNRVNRTVADRLHSASIHLLRRLRREDEAMGLTPARASALSIMVFGGPVTIGSLATAEQVSPPTATRLIVGMERDGLVRREADPDDGRVVWLHATPKGTRTLHEGRRRRVAALAEDLAALTAAEREILAAAADILERLLAQGARGGSGARGGGSAAEHRDGRNRTTATGATDRTGGLRGRGGSGKTDRKSGTGWKDEVTARHVRGSR